MLEYYIIEKKVRNTGFPEINIIPFIPDFIPRGIVGIKISYSVGNPDSLMMPDDLPSTG